MNPIWRRSERSSFFKNRSVLQRDCKHSAHTKLIAAKAAPFYVPFPFVILREASAVYIAASNWRAFFLKENNGSLFHVNFVKR